MSCEIRSGTVGSRARRWLVTLGALMVVVTTATGSGAGTPRPPVLSLSSVTVKRTAPSNGYGGSVTAYMRICLSAGPRAQLLTREWRAVGSRVVARAESVDPLGVDLDRVYPYECAPRYMSSWIVPTRVIAGPGTYYVSFRLRDGYGRTTAPVSFSFHGG